MAGHLVPDLQALLRVLIKRGENNQEIKKQVPVTSSNIWYWLKKVQIATLIKKVVRSPPRPKNRSKYRKREVNAIKRVLRDHDVACVRQLAKNSPLIHGRVPRTSLFRLVKDVVGVKKVSKIRSTVPGPKQKQARVDWACANSGLDTEYIVWTDETTFVASGPTDKQLVIPGQTPRTTVKKQCNPSIKVWGEIGSSGKEGN